MQSEPTEKRDVSYQASYDKELIKIQDTFYEFLMELVMSDMSSVVRRALLTVCLRLYANQQFNDLY